MRIKNIVKVMNFHSLLRVDSSKSKAEKYFSYEKAVRNFIDNILNNKKLILDKKMIKMNENGKELNIYIANDLGFCGNFNSNIRKVLTEDVESDKIIIGKKIKDDEGYENVKLAISKEEYYASVSKIEYLLFESIKNNQYKSFNIIYNHYYNVSKIERVKEQILPLKQIEQTDATEKYNEDFVIEGDINNILINIATLYVSYEIKVAVENSYASENIMRQMITKESLKKIDEIEVETKIKVRKEKSKKNLKKQIDNINKMNLQ